MWGGRRVGGVRFDMGALSRRGFLGSVTGASLVLGCDQEDPVKVEVAASGGGGWEREWEELIADATREGSLSVITWGGRAYQGAIEQFERRFPGIVVEQVAESFPGVWLERVRQGRRAGSQRFDLAFVQPDAALTQGVRDGLWAAIRPLLFRPDVIDDAIWRDGFDGRFLDSQGALCFDWEYQVFHAYAVNLDLVGAGEIQTVLDLLNPKWKGRILTSDPRIGTGLWSATSVVRSKGHAVLEELLVDQRPVVSVGGRDLAEALVSRRFPVALGLRPKSLAPFREQGLADRVAYLDLPDADFVPSTGLLYLDRAPHPAAAKLFANWILTQEGQTILTRDTPTNSARRDVPAFEPDGVGSAGTTYFEPDRDANYAHTAATQRFVNGLLGRGP
jgi:iron(III) transport system substrate-binding protein